MNSEMAYSALYSNRKVYTVSQIWPAGTIEHCSSKKLLDSAKEKNVLFPIIFPPFFRLRVWLNILKTPTSSFGQEKVVSRNSFWAIYEPW